MNLHSLTSFTDAAGPSTSPPTSAAVREGSLRLRPSRAPPPQLTDHEASHQNANTATDVQPSMSAAVCTPFRFHVSPDLPGRDERINNRARSVAPTSTMPPSTIARIDRVCTSRYWHGRGHTNPRTSLLHIRLCSTRRGRWCDVRRPPGRTPKPEVLDPPSSSDPPEQACRPDRDRTAVVPPRSSCWQTVPKPDPVRWLR